MTKRPCSPGEHPHADRRNYTAADYFRMCLDGEAEWSLSEYARLLGVSRMYLHRCLIFASTPEAEFEQVLDDLYAGGKRPSMTAIADEIKRRTGRARRYVERCPHCSGQLRARMR